MIVFLILYLYHNLNPIKVCSSEQCRQVLKKTALSSQYPLQKTDIRHIPVLSHYSRNDLRYWVHDVVDYIKFQNSLHPRERRSNINNNNNNNNKTNSNKYKRRKRDQQDEDEEEEEEENEGEEETREDGDEDYSSVPNQRRGNATTRKVFITTLLSIIRSDFIPLLL